MKHVYAKILQIVKLKILILVHVVNAIQTINYLLMVFHAQFAPSLIALLKAPSHVLAKLVIQAINYHQMLHLVNSVQWFSNATLMIILVIVKIVQQDTQNQMMDKVVLTLVVLLWDLAIFVLKLIIVQVTIKIVVVANVNLNIN